MGNSSNAIDAISFENTKARGEQLFVGKILDARERSQKSKLTVGIFLQIYVSGK